MWLKYWYIRYIQISASITLISSEKQIAKKESYYFILK